MTGAIATETAGAVSGGLRTLLRLEGLTLFAGMILCDLGRIVVDIRHPVSGARSKLRGLPRRASDWRHRL